MAGSLNRHQTTKLKRVTSQLLSFKPKQSKKKKRLKKLSKSIRKRRRGKRRKRRKKRKVPKVTKNKRLIKLTTNQKITLKLLSKKMMRQVKKANQ